MKQLGNLCLLLCALIGTSCVHGSVSPTQEAPLDSSSSKTLQERINQIDEEIEGLKRRKKALAMELNSRDEVTDEQFSVALNIPFILLREATSCTFIEVDSSERRISLFCSEEVTEVLAAEVCELFKGVGIKSFSLENEHQVLECLSPNECSCCVGRGCWKPVSKEN